jgi:hypothetical protein
MGRDSTVSQPTKTKTQLVQNAGRGVVAGLGLTNNWLGRVGRVKFCSIQSLLPL